MNASGFRSMTVTVLLLAASIGIIAAAVFGMKLPTRHNLTIVIVDARNDLPGRQYLRTKVAAMVRKAVNAAARTEVHVRSVVASARDAKAAFERGGYDAALVIGTTEPIVTSRVGSETLAGKLPATSGSEQVSLTFPTRDPALTGWLKEAFSRLLADKTFYASTRGTIQGLNLATVSR